MLVGVTLNEVVAARRKTMKILKFMSPVHSKNHQVGVALARILSSPARGGEVRCGLAVTSPLVL